MQKKAALITITASALYLLLSTAKAMAVSPSDYPSCSNPQGIVKASYSSGIHGIVGSPLEYRGSDTVYQLDPQKLVQCFCADDGRGIQTNWVKTEGMTESEIASHKTEGWIFVPNGALWGLDDTSYLAENIDFSCKGSSNGTSDNRRGGTSNGTSSGIVNASSAVLGLAGTGNTVTLFTALTSSTVAFVLSFLLRKGK